MTDFDRTFAAVFRRNGNYYFASLMVPDQHEGPFATADEAVAAARSYQIARDCNPSNVHDLTELTPEQLEQFGI
jgi:hypothetical protein